MVDADVVAREVVQPGQPALEKIAQHFGDWVLQADGQLDRRALRDYIFQHPEARQQLETITHPIIRQSILSQLQQAQSAYVILVSPLLFETGQDRMTHRNLFGRCERSHPTEKSRPTRCAIDRTDPENYSHTNAAF